MKSVVSVLIGVFVMLASAIPAEAQRLPSRRVGDIIGDVIGGDDSVRAWRDRQRATRDYYGRENDHRYRYDGRQEEWNSWNRRSYRGDYIYEYPYQGQYRGSWGRVIREAGGDPYFDALVVPCEIVPVGRRIKKGIAISALAAIAGGLIGKQYDHPVAGTVIGGVAGGAVALLDDSRLCSPPERVRLPIQSPVGVAQVQPGSQHGVTVSTPASSVPSVPANVAGAGVSALNGNRGPAYRPGPHSLANETRFIVDVYDGNDKEENFVGTIQPGETWDLARPRSRYRGWRQTPNKKGSFDSDELDIRPNANGWTFIN